MPTYSTYQDLADLIDDIGLTYDWIFGDIEFFGTGLNDMNISSDQIETSEADIIYHVVKIQSLAVGGDLVRFSIDNGVTFPAWTRIVLSPNHARVGFNVQLNWDNLTDHTIGDYWKFTTTPQAQVAIREFAYDWVNDNLERIHYEIPIPAPSRTVVLAEATYAIYLYLRARNDARSAAFHQEAIRLITLLTTSKVAAGGVPLEAGKEVREAARLLAAERREVIRARRARARESRAISGV